MARGICRRWLNQQGRLTAMARMSTRPSELQMAPRCSDPGNNRRSSHTSLPMSDIIGRGIPPGLLGCGYCFFDRHPGSWPSKKPIEIGTEECCLKIWSKKGLQKFWCSCQSCVGGMTWGIKRAPVNLRVIRICDTFYVSANLPAL
jgi:hypothetical protein